MGAPKHTPGPWRDDCFNIIATGVDGYPIHLTGSGRLKQDNPEQFQSNLTLIAAAPELLGGLKLAQELLVHTEPGIAKALGLIIAKAEGNE